MSTMCDHTNAYDRPITVWCIGSMVGAQKETICQTHINVPSPYGDLDMKSNQVTPGETELTDGVLWTTTVCSAYQANTITVF